MKKLLLTALITLAATFATSARAQHSGCAVKIDEKKEAASLLGAALDKEGAAAEDLLRHRLKAPIKWRVSKDGSPCPTELTIEGALEYSIQTRASVCTVEADVTKIAFRGGDGTLPRFIVNSKVKTCGDSIAVR